MTIRAIALRALVTSIGLAAVGCGTGEDDGANETNEAVVVPAKGYADPTSWVARPQGAKTGDPLNVVLSGSSDVRSPAELLQALATDWTQVAAGPDVTATKCMTSLLADVEGAAKAQSTSWRPGGCAKVAADVKQGSGPKVGGAERNHLRGWAQASSGAWFMAASEEHLCLKLQCIDDVGAGGVGGFNQGRDDLKALLVLSASQHHMQVVDGQGSTCPIPTTGVGCLAWHYDTSPPVGSDAGSNGVTSDGQVVILTIKKGPDWLAEFPKGTDAKMPVATVARPLTDGASPTFASDAGTPIVPSTATTPSGLPTSPSASSPSRPSSSPATPSSATPSKPTASKPTASKPTASTPTASKPTASKPTASKPTASNSTPSKTNPSSMTPGQSADGDTSLVGSCSALRAQQASLYDQDGSTDDDGLDTRNGTVVGVDDPDTSGCLGDDDEPSLPIPDDDMGPDGSSPDDGSLPPDGSSPDDGSLPPDGSSPDDGSLPPDGSSPDDGSLPPDSSTPDDGYPPDDGSSYDE